MSQKAGSAAANLLVFATFFLLMVYQVTSSPAISRHRKHVTRHGNSPWNRNVRIITNEINQIFKPSNSPVEIFRDHRLAPEYEKIVEKHNPTDEASTSCGEITCDDVPDYPKERIIELLQEAQGDQLKLSAHRPLYRMPYARTNLMKEELEEEMFDKAKLYKSRSFSGKERSHCINQVQETRPKEALTRDGQKVKIVNVENQHEVKGSKCLADEWCRDDSIAEMYVLHCTTKKVEQSVLAYVKPGNKYMDYLANITVIMTDGCECVKERSEYAKY